MCRAAGSDTQMVVNPWFVSIASVGRWKIRLWRIESYRHQVTRFSDFRQAASGALSIGSIARILRFA